MVKPRPDANGEGAKKLRFISPLCITFMVCASLPIGSLAQELPADMATIRFVKNPAPLPQISLKTLDGKSIGSGELQGKVVLLNFWATWCAPCLDEISYFTRLQSRYADRLQIIGLSLDSGPPESVSVSLKRFAQQHGINYPLAIASSEIQTALGGILGLPTTFLIDEHGRIVQKHIGISDPGIYETEVRALIGLPVAAKIEYFEDAGQVFPAKAKTVSQLPGVDLSKLTPDQKEKALRLLAARMCPCGCKMTLAQCRIIDSACPTSLRQAIKIVEESGAESESPPARPSQQ